jgi:hypothetical protein
MLSHESEIVKSSALEKEHRSNGQAVETQSTMWASVGSGVSQRASTSPTTIITVRSLIRRSWTTHRWDNRPRRLR